MFNKQKTSSQMQDQGLLQQSVGIWNAQLMNMSILLTVPLSWRKMSYREGAHDVEGAGIGLHGCCHVPMRGHESPITISRRDLKATGSSDLDLSNFVQRSICFDILKAIIIFLPLDEIWKALITWFGGLSRRDLKRIPSQQYQPTLHSTPANISRSWHGWGSYMASATLFGKVSTRETHIRALWCHLGLRRNIIRGASMSRKGGTIRQISKLNILPCPESEKPRTNKTDQQLTLKTVLYIIGWCHTNLIHILHQQLIRVKWQLCNGMLMWQYLMVITHWLARSPHVIAYVGKFLSKHM